MCMILYAAKLEKNLCQNEFNPVQSANAIVFFGKMKKKMYFCTKKNERMQNDTEQIARLQKVIEKVVGRKIELPKDFDFLVKQIEGYVGEHISISTVKRVWGYVPASSEVSLYTLNLLSRMVGYADWKDFCQNQNCNNEENGLEESSHKIICRKLFTSALTRGDMLSIIWQPERKIVIQYEGQDQFIVKDSLNSKLKTGDIFHCLQFIEHQPLFLLGVYRKGMPPSDFICGRRGGIVWSIIEQKEVLS